VQKEYVALLGATRSFLEAAMHECRTVDEVACVLRQSDGTSVANDEALPRVSLALDAHVAPLLTDRLVQAGYGRARASMHTR